MEYARSLGRADFVGGIENEALDFGQLESFVHLPAINTSNNNGNTSAITLAITAVTTTPAHTITTASASVVPTNAPTHGTLPESPPDSGSEPPYSPTDLHAISNLNQIAYHQHQYSNNSQSAHPHQLDQSMHVNGTTNIDCHNGIIVNGNTNNPTSSIHKTEDILLSSTAMPLNNSITNMMPNNDMMMPQNSLLGLGVHHPINMGRNNVYRSDGNNLLTLNSEDDFSCFINDPMFQMSTNGLNCHQSPINHQQQQSVTSHTNINSYNPHVLSQIPTAMVPTSHSAEIPHLLNTRKRPNDYNAQSILESSNEQQSMRNVTPIKRSTSVILPAIKPEPDALSPLCVTTLIEPATPPSKSSVDVCSNVSSCSTSITSPASTTIMMPSMVESNLSPNLQQQSQGQSQQGNGNANESGSNDSFPMQCIRFSPFQQQNWHILCDQSLQELPLPHYRVDADKGFNFSNSDDAFVCQKKNHFQITCHAQAQGAPAIFVRTESGLEKIKSFHLHFYGVKLETPTQTIRIEQSQSDRSKKPFHPVPIDLQSRQVSKITVGRLHFSETTSNNMRKKGRPNPEQRYFQLVVGLHAHTHSGNFPVVSQGSERIIVRASNPGQFESDVELCWQRGATQDSIFTHASRVGINTDRPDESLVIHGNLKVSGHIVHPSDSRAKQEIGELDTSQQLQNVKRIRVVRYRYDPEFAMHHGLIKTPAIQSAKINKTNDISDSNTSPNTVIEVIDTGVIAQEVREVLPDAVQETGSVLLPSGEVIDNFLVVNKDRIYMENIGAVKELCKVTGSLETRIEHLERMNSRLVQVRKIDQHKSDCSHSKCKFNQYDADSSEPCSNKMIQITIVILVIIMAICLAALSTLYFVEHIKKNEQNHHYDELSERNALVNGSYGGNGIEHGRLNRSWSSSTINYKNDGRYMAKKISKQVQHNTQDASSTQSLVESGPPIAGSQSDGKLNCTKDVDNQTKTTTTLFQITPDEVEKPSDYGNNYSTINETNVKQSKLSTSKYNNDVTTEKVVPIESNAEKIIENDPSIFEPDANSSNNENPSDGDITSNFIDDSQQPSPNNTKTDDKKGRIIDIENRNTKEDYSSFETDFYLERKLRIPIGQPLHCDQFTKLNQTATGPLQSLCSSFCTVIVGHETGKTNQVSDIVDSPDSIPENAENVEAIIETSTTSKLQKITTTKLYPINERKESIEPSTTLSEHFNHTSIEQTTAKDKIDANIQGPSSNDEKSNFSGMAVQAEQPVEVNLSILPPNTISPLILQSNYSAKVEPITLVVDSPKKPNHLVTSKHFENDRKPFKKIENKFEKSQLEAAIDIPKSTNGNLEPQATYTTNSQIKTSTPVEASNSDCFQIDLLFRSESVNKTLWSEEICHNINITYNIPLSKYMKESRFDLVFVTQNSLQWTLCSVKGSNGKESQDSHNFTDENTFYSRDSGYRASFMVDIPFSDFNRQMEFQANLQPLDSTPCWTPALLNGSHMQTVLYKINIYRDCTQQ